MKNSQNTFVEGIGNTPLIKLKAASEITGCNIYGKAEYLNPGGSVKDRAALALIKDAEEKKLIKGIIINRFRGDLSLFTEGKKWIESKTKIPVIGIIPWLNDSFPPEDSLDLIEKKSSFSNPEIKVGIIKLPSISNFSDFDPLENEESILTEWIRESQDLRKYDFIIIPGSKQTIKDQIFLENSGLSQDIREYSNSNGNIVGICGGLQMLGTTLEDPYFKEGSKNYSEQKIKGIGLLPLKTIFLKYI